MMGCISIARPAAAFPEALVEEVLSRVCALEWAAQGSVNANPASSVRILRIEEVGIPRRPWLCSYDLASKFSIVAVGQSKRSLF
jgi:hypothetical protein